MYLGRPPNTLNTYCTCRVRMLRVMEEVRASTTLIPLSTQNVPAGETPQSPPPKAVYVHVCTFLPCENPRLSFAHAPTLHLPCTAGVCVHVFRSVDAREQRTVCGGVLRAYGVVWPCVCCHARFNEPIYEQSSTVQRRLLGRMLRRAPGRTRAQRRARSEHGYLTTDAYEWPQCECLSTVRLTPHHVVVGQSPD